MDEVDPAAAAVEQVAPTAGQVDQSAVPRNQGAVIGRPRGTTQGPRRAGAEAPSPGSTPRAGGTGNELAQHQPGPGTNDPTGADT